jgi:hypothetical protein
MTIHDNILCVTIIMISANPLVLFYCIVIAIKIQSICMYIIDANYQSTTILILTHIQYKPSRAERAERATPTPLRASRMGSLLGSARLVSEQDAPMLVNDEPKNIMLGSLGSFPTLKFYAGFIS